MGDSSSGNRIVGKVSVISGSILAVLAFMTAVLTNLGTIKETVDKMLSSPGAKVTLVQSRLIFGLGVAIPDEIPGIIFFRERPSEEMVGEGDVLIDLRKASEGDSENHRKLAEAAELAQLIILPRLTRSPEGFALIDNSQVKSVFPAEVRVLIQKDTVPILINCKIKIYYPNADSTVTFTSINLPAGTWKNYFEFGILLREDFRNKTKITSKWEAMLTCEANGKAAGDGPVPLAVGP